MVICFSCCCDVSPLRAGFLQLQTKVLLYGGARQRCCMQTCRAPKKALPIIGRDGDFRALGMMSNEVTLEFMSMLNCVDGVLLECASGYCCTDWGAVAPGKSPVIPVGQPHACLAC